LLDRVAVAVAGCLPALACAWGPVGHQAVGAIAQQMLTPAAQSAVAELLRGDLDRDGRPSGRTTLAEISEWPDEIRGTAADHPHWHYDNEPICGSDRPPSSWCAQGDCASAEVTAQLAILADRGQPQRQRNEALKWVVHLVGDLHMPLHAADFAQGGNLIKVAPAGRPRPGRGARQADSLHWFWDNRLVILALHPSRGEIPPRSMRRLLEQAQAETAAQVAAGPDRWADESNRIARDFTLKIDGLGCALDGTRDFPMVALSDEYVAQGKRIVEERIALAGARLAYALNRAVGDAP
jgi:hypothetical protein